MTKLQPIAKALVPAALSLLTVLGNSLISGEFNTASILLAATGIVTALATYIVPNKAAPAPSAPVPADGLTEPLTASSEPAFAGRPDEAKPPEATPAPVVSAPVQS